MIPTTVQAHCTPPSALSARSQVVNANILGQASLSILKNHITEAKAADLPLRAAYDEQVAHLHSLVDSEELHNSLTQHLASGQYSTFKQTVNSHRQRLKNLLCKAGRPPQPDLDNTAVSDVSVLLNNTATSLPPSLAPGNPSTSTGYSISARNSCQGLSIVGNKGDLQGSHLSLWSPTTLTFP